MYINYKHYFVKFDYTKLNYVWVKSFTIVGYTKNNFRMILKN